MTNEEAIEILNRIMTIHYCDAKEYDALYIAIKALKKRTPKKQKTT